MLLSLIAFVVMQAQAITDSLPPAPTVQAPSSYVDVTETIVVQADPVKFYQILIETPLEATLHSSKGIPDVTGTTLIRGTWPNPGSTRIVHLADGSQVLEQFLASEPGKTFSYVVWDIRNELGGVADHVHGQWWFAANADGTTTVTWTYAVMPKPGRRWLVGLFVRPRIRKFLRQTLQNYSTYVRTGSAPKATAK